MENSETVPFYANTPDDTRCVQACSGMILSHMLHRDFSWQELDDLVQGGPGETISPPAPLLGMAKLGLQTILISDFDHVRFSQDGIDYIRSVYGDEMADWELASNNIEKSRKISQEVLSSSVLCEYRVPILDDVKQQWEKSRMVFCGVNAKILNDEEGYCGHAVVILGMDETTVMLHDPGLPPRPHREVPIQKFVRAWESRGPNVRAVGFS